MSASDHDNPTKSENVITHFGDALAKILKNDRVPKAGDAPILSKARGIERKLDESILEKKARHLVNVDRKMKRDKERIKQLAPEKLDAEKRLRKTATKGVIKLFNALREQQKAVERLKETSSLVRPATVVESSKSTFMKSLKPKEEAGDGESSGWDVLRNDYGMNASLKNWDESEDEDEEK